MRAFLLCLVCSVTMGAGMEHLPIIHTPREPMPPTLLDIYSRLPAGTDAREPDLVTFAHEGAHFLSGSRPGHHGIYIGKGIRVYIPTPPLITEQVFAQVPVDRRGAIYQTYLRQGQTEYWAAQPLMILDEWNAYIAGSSARLELSLDTRRESDIYCATMAGYAAVLYRMAKDCPDYPITELKDFCRLQLGRCREAIPDWDQLSDATFD